MAAPAGNRSIREYSLAQLREEMICPLSYELLEDPLVEKVGHCARHVFSAEWIRAWLDTDQSCPLARTPLTERDLMPHRRITRACRLLRKEEESLSRDDIEAIYIGAEALLGSGEQRLCVSEEIHNMVSELVSQIFDSKRRCTEAIIGSFGC